MMPFDPGTASMAKSFVQNLADRLFGETLQLNLTSGDEPQELPVATGLIQLNLTGNDRPAQTTPQAPATPLQKAPDLSGSGVSVVDLGFNAYSRLLRKPNVDLLRNYAKNSAWVRAAIDYHRRVLGRSAYEIVPIDSTLKPTRRDKNVKAEIEKLLRHPNAADESYGQLKEQMIEDYLVIGHGCLELDLLRDLTVSGMRVLDAAKIGFVRDWDGTDRTIPRFCEFKDKSGSTIKRYLAHEQVFCLLNRPQSDTKLGFSHVEALHKTIVALLSGDDFMIQQLLQPIPDTLLNLGEGVTKQQVEEFKYQIQQVRNKLAIVGGAKGTEVKRLSANAEEMQILDGQQWYVRQVAAVFGMSTAKLKLAVDTSNANTKSMYEDDLEMITGELTRIEELETATFINRYSYQGDVNLRFFYPIMQRKDEKEQAQIARASTGQAWTSINEARTRTGEKPLDSNKFPYVDEPIISTKEGPVPLSVWSKKVQEIEENIGKEPESEPQTADPQNAETDDNEDPAGGTATDDDTSQQ